MTHLDERITSLADGRLAPDAAERALAHARACATCGAALARELRVRAVLRSATDPQPSDELVAHLLALGGPAGPLGPRPGHVPGTPRPAPLPPPGRLLIRAGPWESPGPAARPAARRITSAAVGALSLASLGLLGLVVLGSWFSGPVLSPAASELVLEAGRAQALDAADVERLRQDGWSCPGALPGGLRLVSARAVDVSGGSAVHLRYTDGRSTVSVVEQRGRLDAGDVPAFSTSVVGGVPLLERQGDPWHGVWQSGDLVISVVADAPAHVVADVVAALPHERPDDGWWDRVDDGAQLVASVLTSR